jgi:hypothetical protein
MFGADSRSAFETQPSPMQDLLSIVGGVYQGVKAAGDTFETANKINRRHDVKLTEEMESDLAEIDSRTDLTPEQKQIRKAERVGQASSGVITEKAKYFLKNQSEIYRNAITALNDEENLENQFLALNERLLKTSLPDRLEMINSNRGPLTKEYPAFKDIIDDKIDKMAADTHGLIYQERIGKSLTNFKILAGEFAESPEFDPRELGPEAFYDIVMGAMGAQSEAGIKDLIPAEDETYLQDLLKVEASNMLMDLKAQANNNDRQARKFKTVAMAADNPESTTVLRSAWKLDGLLSIRGTFTDPNMPANLGSGYGQGLRNLRQELVSTDRNNVSNLINFLRDARSHQHFDHTYPFIERQREGVRIANEERFDQSSPNFSYAVTDEELLAMQESAGIILDNAVKHQVERIKFGQADGRDPTEFAMQAYEAYTRVDNKTIEDSIARATATQRQTQEQENTQSSVEYFSKMKPSSDNWQTDLNQLHGDIQMAQEEIRNQGKNWNLRFNFMNRGFAPTVTGYSSVEFEDDIQALDEEIRTLNSYGGWNIVAQTANKTEIDVAKRVEAINGIFKKHELTMSIPKNLSKAEEDNRRHLDFQTEPIHANKPATESAPTLNTAFRTVKPGMLKTQLDAVGTAFLSELTSSGWLERNVVTMGEATQDFFANQIDEWSSILNDENSTNEARLGATLRLIESFQNSQNQSASDHANRTTQTAFDQINEASKRALISLYDFAESQTEGKFRRVQSNTEGNPVSLQINPENANGFNTLWGDLQTHMITFGSLNGFERSTGGTVGAISGGIKAVGQRLQSAASKGDTPEERRTNAWMSLNENDRAIINTVMTAAQNPQTLGLIPDAVLDATRDAFMPVLLGDSPAALNEYERLRNQAKTDPLAAATLTMVDQDMHKMMQFGQPSGNKTAEQAATEAATISLGESNTVVTYLAQWTQEDNSVSSPVTVPRAEIINSSLLEKAFDYSSGGDGMFAGYVTDGRENVTFNTIPGITTGARFAFTLSGLPLQEEGVFSPLVRTAHIQSSALDALAAEFPNLDRGRTQFKRRYELRDRMSSSRSLESSENRIMQGLQGEGSVMYGLLPTDSQITFYPRVLDPDKATLARQVNETTGVEEWVTVDDEGNLERVETAEQFTAALEKNIEQGHMEMGVTSQFATSDITAQNGRANPTINMGRPLANPQEIFAQGVSAPPAYAERLSIESTIPAPQGSGNRIITSFIENDLVPVFQELEIFPNRATVEKALAQMVDASVANRQYRGERGSPRGVAMAVDTKLERDQDVGLTGTGDTAVYTSDMGRSLADDRLLIDYLTIFKQELEFALADPEEYVARSGKKTMEAALELTLEDLTSNVSTGGITKNPHDKGKHTAKTYRSGDNGNIIMAPLLSTGSNRGMYESDPALEERLMAASLSNQNKRKVPFGRDWQLSDAALKNNPRKWGSLQMLRDSEKSLSRGYRPDWVPSYVSRRPSLGNASDLNNYYDNLTADQYYKQQIRLPARHTLNTMRMGD